MNEEIPSINIEEVTPDDMLLDVRELDEWEAGHAPNAVHLALSTLAENGLEVVEGTRVQVICKVGGRSAQATNYLRSLGIDAVNVSGGMLAWEQAGQEVVTDSGETGWVS